MDTSKSKVPKFALYYRSDNNGKWYEEGCFSCEWEAHEYMLDHIKTHSDLDCIIVHLSLFREYRGHSDPLDGRTD
jgi:hypothetical protein